MQPGSAKSTESALTITIGVDWHEERHARDEAHAGRQVREDDRRAGREQGEQRFDALGRPANVYGEPKTNELFIADGDINKRMSVFDARTGAYRRQWDVYGERPDDSVRCSYLVRPASPPAQCSTVHGLLGTKHGLPYVSDRRGNRIRLFRQNGEYLME